MNKQINDHQVRVSIEALCNQLQNLEKTIARLLDAPQTLEPPGEVKARKKRGYWFAAGYFFLPLLLVVAARWQYPGLFVTIESDRPVYWWRFVYCCCAGCWGLAIRAFERGGKDQKWTDYWTLYPIVLLMNACAVFAVLTAFNTRLLGLFWPAAIALCMVLGRYSNPKEWLLTKFIVKEAKDVT